MTFTEPTILTGLLVGEGNGILGVPPSPTNIDGIPVSATLEIQSTVGAFLINRMTAAQAVALGTVVDGMMIYVTSTGPQFPAVGLYLRTGGNWVNLSAGGGGGAPVDAKYLISEANPTLPNAYVVEAGVVTNVNTRVGRSSMSKADTAPGTFTAALNCGFGQASLEQLLSGNSNSAFGQLSLKSLTTGSGNVGVGHFALQNSVADINNSCIGLSSGEYINGGSSNSCLGANSGPGSTTPLVNNSVYIGAFATSITNNTNDSVAIGYQASFGANKTIAIGAQSKANADSAIAIGQEAEATGDSSIAIGEDTVVSAQYAMAIGDSSSASAINSIAIGNNVDVINPNTIGLGNACSVGIGTFSPKWPLTINNINPHGSTKTSASIGLQDSDDDPDAPTNAGDGVIYVKDGVLNFKTSTSEMPIAVVGSILTKRYTFDHTQILTPNGLTILAAPGPNLFYNVFYCTVDYHFDTTALTGNTTDIGLFYGPPFGTYVNALGSPQFNHILLQSGNSACQTLPQTGTNIFVTTASGGTYPADNKPITLAKSDGTGWLAGGANCTLTITVQYTIESLA